ncbi:UDP-glucose 4-epimerase, partial [bacterium]|nr:UDP-glucose 4-epimerase [bacterium]
VFGHDYPTDDGTCIRDYIHVTDLADAHILALNYLSETNKSDVFNLGNGNGFSVDRVIETARAITGRAIPVTRGARRPGDPAVLIGRSEKASRVLGWKPKFNSLEHIVSTAWNWHQLRFK